MKLISAQIAPAGAVVNLHSLFTFFLFLILVHAYVWIQLWGTFDQTELKSALIEMNLNDSLGGK